MIGTTDHCNCKLKQEIHRQLDTLASHAQSTSNAIGRHYLLRGDPQINSWNQDGRPLTLGSTHPSLLSLFF